jgi:hypothetical protein
VRAEDPTTYSFGWNRAFELAALGLRCSYTDDGTFSLGMSVDFGIGRQPASGNWMQLLEGEETVVQEVESAFDGFYLFERVPFGRYSVRIAPEQVEQLNLIAPNPWTVTIDSDELVASGIHFILEAPPE